MDPLTTVGLASNILSFVVFARDIVSSAGKLYKSSSGTTAEHLESERLAEEIRHRAANFSLPPVQDESTLPEDDRFLRELSRQCQGVADELLVELQGLKVDGSHKGWKSLYQAFRGALNRDKLKSLQQRLDRLGNQINFQLILKNQRNVIDQLANLQAISQGHAGNRSAEMVALDNRLRYLFRERAEHIHVKKELVKLSAAFEQGRRLLAEQRIWNFLRFEAMDYRYLTVTQAHQGTFNWIREPASFSSNPTGSDTFFDWLKSNSTTYWISGKLGSGKSTLMKYLCSLPAVQERLELWNPSATGTDSSKLIFASFFFWNAGRSSLQKSQEGLLRQLLWDIFRECPSLISVAYPELLQLYTASGAMHPEETNKPGLTVPELTQALQRVFDHVDKEQKLKFCFFIDGLDEYEGKPDDIIHLVSLFRASRRVKLCVSSRPWNEFEKAFGGDGLCMLRVQDLTRDDITLFVRDTLEKDANFQELREDDETCVDLVREITHRANGVFLWVRLVVQSLLQGVTNADTVADLRRRLNSFPTDLYEFFERELLSVDAFYRQRTARFFQVTVTSLEVLPLVCYWFVDQEADPDAVVSAPAAPWPVQRTNVRLKQMRKRLNACCKGLLEAQLYDGDKRSSSLSSSIMFNMRVDFAHRTVRDFFLASDIHKLLAGWSGPGFNASVGICEAILGQIKASPLDKDYCAKAGPVAMLVYAFNRQTAAGSIPVALHPRTDILIDQINKLIKPFGLKHAAEELFSGV
ncbi:hypothetical protein B0T24DRAFT_237832 [Lasiosphaeria ovina]|uniref:NACHT domain-containing protein n=1 Tax=Lasiosphaeria ovina TaxID=92902 RepID=A0AAE0KIC4_9PEZI|nr:hypothetical protein B0T24DRAFT_237832 [Lasiosphaeria ovina]